ncbi:MAG: hypothetical protein DBY45_02225 [Clostridiales bacterium]|nr:MAG: hypothetical protein DBY45_02225 [Clostridiales bacterium]
MKKIIRLSLVTLVLGIVFCLCLGATKSESVEFKDLGNGFSYTYDSSTETLKLQGKGYWPEIETFTEYPIQTLIISDGITVVNAFCDAGSYGRYEENVILPNTIVMGKDCEGVYNNILNEYLPAKLEFKVDPQNPYYATYDGVLYTKDYKKLVRCPIDKKTIKFHPSVEILAEYSFAGSGLSRFGNLLETALDGRHSFVIPWGVTTIEGELFPSRYGHSRAIVIPDTAIYFGYKGASEEIRHNGYDSWFHNELMKKRYGYEVVRHYPLSSKGIENPQVDVVEVGKVYDFVFYDCYGIKPNSLKTFQNGKTYFFGPNYEYAKGWKQVNGNWYYFNDYGAAVVKIWLKSGNKWYFMQADGTMATNKWIQWYNKWYYVGSDGAMYANRYTPDGYWVNGSGVWVK